MTDRLYYTDPYLRVFDATVLAVEARPRSPGSQGSPGSPGRPESPGRNDQLIVFLDRTAFYPTSGGQPFDTGTLAGLPVVEVVDRDDGSIAHILGAPKDTGEAREAGEAGEVGGVPGVRGGQIVHGVIDWDRRFDHMQQHTGQHLLSAAFDRLFDVRTVSFHLGAELSTIDLQREMTAAEITAAEREANRVVWEDRPVSIRFVAREEAEGMPLRKESRREGTLRLIDVEDFDLSACGGTHVARTGAVGVIAVISWERFKGGQRLGFVSGGRALGRLRAWHDTLTSSTRLLSVLPGELPSVIEKMQAESREQKRALNALQTELSRYRADELAAGAEPIAAGRLVLRAVDADAVGLKALAGGVASRAGHIAVLTSTSTPALVVIARASDLSDLSAQRLLAGLTSTFGGRGGGKAELAQGGGLDGSPDAILAAARAAIVSA